MGLPDGTKRNSKQGVKGSLARYLLRTMKLKMGEMTQFVADVLKANYLSPKYPQDYVDFVELLAEKYPRIMQSDTVPSKHIRSFYLNNDPRKLGGRVVGPEGWPGSNNGGVPRMARGKLSLMNE